MEIDRLRQMQNSLIALRVDTIGRKTRWERIKDIPFEERLTLVNSELIQDTNIQNLLQAGTRRFGLCQQLVALSFQRSDG